VCVCAFSWVFCSGFCLHLFSWVFVFSLFHGFLFLWSLSVFVSDCFQFVFVSVCFGFCFQIVFSVGVSCFFRLVFQAEEEGVLYT